MYLSSNFYDRQMKVYEYQQKKAAEKSNAQLREQVAAQRERDSIKEFTYNSMLSPYHKKLQESERASRSTLTIIKNLTQQFLEGVLCDFVELSYSKNVMSGISDEDKKLMSCVLDGLVEEVGFENMIGMMEHASVVTASIMQDIREAVDKAIETADTSGSEISIDPSIEGDLLKSINGDETMDAISTAVAAKVANANSEFILKMNVDNTKIQDALSQTQANIADIHTGDDETDKKIAESYTQLANRKIRDIEENSNRNIYEQLVYNLSKAVIKSENLKEQYLNENGHINMEKIDGKVGVVYTLYESLNSLGILPQDTKFISSLISIELE